MKWIYIIIIVGILILGVGAIMYNQQLVQISDISKEYLKGILEYYTIPENTVQLSNLNNVTAETNFTHLNISTTVPYDSLVGYWNFDGDKENTLLTKHYDWSKYNNDGTGVGNVIVNSSNCIYGDCAKFDGTGDYVSTPTTGITSVAGTVVIWIKDNGSAAYHGYWQYGASLSNTNFIQLITDGTYWEIIAACDGQNKNIGDIFTIDTLWHQIIITWSVSANQLLTYVDGQPIADKVNNWAVFGTEQTPFYFGYADYNGASKALIDDVMIFNTSLTSAQILAIYNNQSARFLATGTQDIVNQSYMNISTGNNRVNVTTYTESLLGSSINLSVGYYDGSWHVTTPQVVSSGTVKTFNITSTSTNLTLNYTFYAGNSTNSFYSPIIKDNITYTIWNEVSGDTSYPTFSTYYDNNGSLLDTGLGLFNVTVENTNGTVILHINNSNILATNLTADVYNASYNFTQAGTYLYNWTAYGNGTSHLLNTSINRYYVVNSSAPANCWTKTGSGRGSILFIPRGCVYQVNKGSVGQ